MLIATMFFLVPGFWQSTMEPADELMICLAAAKEREELCFRNCTWQFKLQRGITTNEKSALAGEFSDGSPYTERAGRLFASNGEFFYSLSASKRISLKAGVVQLRFPSEYWMATRETRLHGSNGSGEIQIRSRELTDGLKPSGIPVHGMQFGAGRISAFMDDVERGRYTVAACDHVLKGGTRCRKFTLDDEGYRQEIYFETGRTSCLRGHRSFRDGKALGGSQVIRVAEMLVDEKQVWLPADSVCWRFSREGVGLHMIKTSHIRLDPADRSGMAVNVLGGRFSIHPDGVGIRPERETVTIDSLDEFADEMLVAFNAKREEALRLESQASTPPPPIRNRSLDLMLIGSFLIALVVFLLAHAKMKTDS